MSFEFSHLIPPLERALRDEGYTEPTPIQVKAIPVAFEGRDLLGCAQTGTGKTAAFALPILTGLDAARKTLGRGRPRALILAPTRELAAQIGESFRVYGRHTHVRTTVVFGGVGYGNQLRTLDDGVHVLVATPGRLLDLLERRAVNLGSVEWLVLDEADRMLDMGFIHDVRRVLRHVPAERQTMLFSATMPPEIRYLANEILRDPVYVAATPTATVVGTIAQSAYLVDRADKRSLLLSLVRDPSVTRALVFTRTKHAANRVAAQLEKAGVEAAAIHGNKSQGARERALSAFKSGAVRLLVATDIAARGIDIDGVSHVINFDLPDEPEAYVHRIGRTGRAGASGIAWSFCDPSERQALAAIERTTRMRVPIVAPGLRDPSARSAPRPLSSPAPRPGPRRPAEACLRPSRLLHPALARTA